MFALKFITFLNVGRHFRLDDSTKLIIGRNYNDNEYMEKLIENSANQKNLILQAKDIPGPIGILQSREEIVSDEILKLSAEILVRYLSKANDEAVVNVQFPDDQVKEILSIKRTDGFERKMLLN